MRNKAGEAAKRAISEREARKVLNRERIHYQKTFATIARGMVLRGWNQKMIAEAFGVSEATVSQWKKQHREFREAISSGKEQLIAKAVAVGFDLATGAYRQGKTELFYDSKTGKIQERQTKDTLPPNPTLLKYYLQNMASETFKDKQEMDVHVDGVDFTLQVVDSL